MSRLLAGAAGTVDIPCTMTSMAPGVILEAPSITVSKGHHVIDVRDVTSGRSARRTIDVPTRVQSDGSSIDASQVLITIRADKLEISDLAIGFEFT